MVTIPSGYVPTLMAARGYLSRNSDVVRAYNAAIGPGRWGELTSAWAHFQDFGNKEDRLWDFPDEMAAPIISNPPETAGILDGEIFGVSKKLLVVGVIAYFVFAGKG